MATASTSRAAPHTASGTSRAGSRASRPRCPPRRALATTEPEAFNEFIKSASIRSRVELGYGDNGRGLFTTGPAGWKEIELLLEVPLDVCIVAPVGDGDAASEDITARKIVESWERRNATVPEGIKNMMFSKSGEDRELGVALWLLFAVREGGKVWESYGKWLPKKRELPSLLLATSDELAMTQNEAIVRQAAFLKAEVRKIFDGLASGLVPGSVTFEDLCWAFSIVKSRAIAAEVGANPGGNDDTAVAVLAPCVDMANHVDAAKVTALKKIGASDGGGLRGAYWRVITGGNIEGGGGSCCLETNRPLAAKGEEITISYVPAADNLELMMSYGFALRGNRNDRINIPMTETTSSRLRLGALRYALEDVGLMSAATAEEDIRRLIAIVGSACIIPPGANIVDDDWELSAEDAERQVGNAQTIAEAWEDELDAFPTTLEADEELLESNVKYDTAFGRAALLFRIERKRLLTAGIDAMYEYINWLYADSEEEESSDSLPAGMA
jgi:hypothetical protein